MIKIGIIGIGSWGKNLLRTFSQLANCQVIYACDIDMDIISQLAPFYPQVKFVADYQEVCQSPLVEAIAIATTVSTHYPIANEALKNGKHTFVEKPFTQKAEEACKLISLAAKNQLILMAGHLLKYHPAVVRLKEIVDSGELGEIYYIYTQRVSLGRVCIDENAMWSLAPHDISVITYLLNEKPKAVWAQGKSYLRAGIDDVCFLNLDFSNGKMANIQISWLDPHKIRQMTIVGSKKMVLFDDMAATEKLKVYDRGFIQDYNTYGDSLTVRFGEIHIPVIHMHEPLREECIHFLDCIAKNKKPKSDGAEGLEVVQILEAAEKSRNLGGMPVPIS